MDAVLIGLLLREAPLRAIAADWHTLLYTLVALIPATLLGCMAGAMFLSEPVRIVCSRINGAPLRIGDQVLILSGPHKGTITEVYEITRGQGGWELARVDLAKECEERRHDIFWEYSLLRIRRTQPPPALNWRQLAEYSGIRPSILFVYAHPWAIASVWLLAGSAASALLIVWFMDSVPSSDVAGYISGRLFFAALVVLLVQLVCIKISTGPLKPGDRVVVLFGAYKGTTAEVSEIVFQNYGPVAVLDLGLKHKQAFDRMSLLKIRKNAQGGAADRSPGGES